MWLKAKIKSKYLDEILSGRKRVEYRQVEGLELSDGKRIVKCKVIRLNIYNCGTKSYLLQVMDLQSKYPDVEWNEELPILVIYLGKPENSVIDTWR